MMECQYVATQRGGIALVFEGHRYNKVRDGKDGTVYWRCSRDRQCPGRAVTVNNRVKKANNKHNHPAEASLRNGTSSSSSANSISSSNLSLSNSNITTNNHSQDVSQLRLSSSLALQNVLNVQSATTGVSFPTIVTETLKYLALASGNHQIASFASSMANLSNPSIENFERTLRSSSLLSGATDYYNNSFDDQPLNMSIRNTGQLIKRLRSIMKNSTFVSEPISAYIIPSCDSHQSEYIAECDKRTAFISGFTGSSSLSVVTLDDTALWTDGRYFLQAEKELGSNWILMKDGIPGATTPGEWLCKVLPKGSRVGGDPNLISYSSWKLFSSQMESNSLKLIPIYENLIDLIWEEKPSMPSNPIDSFHISLAGQMWQEKVNDIRKEMSKKDASALVLTALDETAWLFNLRGSDIPHCPVFFAYTVITMDSIYLFMDEDKLTSASRKHLNLDLSPVHHQSDFCIELRPYKLIQDFLKWFVSQQAGKIWISNESSYALVNAIPESRRIDSPNPVLINKAIKNSVEIECIKRAHVKDAVALCEFYSWLEDELNKGEEVDELTAASKLEEFRRTQEDYTGPSFETISASGPNAAIIHYRSSPETNRLITKDELYLCDSGAQFKDGTTDVTRTTHMGTPTAYERECFTRVVKGHIGLSQAIFPSQIKGQMLDTLARKYLWEVGLDYIHGTGHGVGMYLNVHEGPMGIHFKTYPNDPGLKEGMILSVEPGYYEEKKFGIRIENLVLVKKAETENNFMNKGYLSFEPITLVPIQVKLLEPALLTIEEIDWLDNYHSTCREVVGKALREQGRTNGLQWLLKETQPLG